MVHSCLCIENHKILVIFGKKITKFRTKRRKTSQKSSFFPIFAAINNFKSKHYGTKGLDDCLQQHQDDGAERRARHEIIKPREGNGTEIQQR